MKDALQIFRFLRDAAARGEECALVTLTEVVGSSARATGSHMAVRVGRDGKNAHLGSFSGGCVEQAVVAEAREVLARGEGAALVRFGIGSSYIDIRLPCGGGIDLLFTPDPPLNVLDEIVGMLEQRRTVRIRLGLDGSLVVSEGPDANGASPFEGGVFFATHHPDLRLVVVGQGEEPEALARLARSYGASALVISPDDELLERINRSGGETRHIATAAAPVDLRADAHTAIVFLFHDHDWELPLLARALATPAFYVGAMGSRATHRQRCDALLARGATREQIARIAGPAGLIAATRDPQTLALSILAEIVDRERTSAGVDRGRAGEKDAGRLPQAETIGGLDA